MDSMATKVPHKTSFYCCSAITCFLLHVICIIVLWTYRFLKCKQKVLADRIRSIFFYSAITQETQLSSGTFSSRSWSANLARPQEEVFWFWITFGNQNNSGVVDGLTVWDRALAVPIFSGISMFVKCDSDITVFILNFSITSTFCLRRECSSLKPTVLLILALCDWCAVFFGTFARLTNVWQFPYCICEQPQVLLQTGVFVLNIIVLTLNTDLSDTVPVTKRNSYVHLVLFNLAAVTFSYGVTEGIAHAFDVVGGTLEANHVSGTTFLVSVYRAMFLSLDWLYHAYAKLKYSGKRCRFIEELRRGGKMIVI